MSAPAFELPAELPLAEARDAARRQRFASFPVVDRDGAAVGLLPMARATAAHGATAGEAAVRDPDLLLGPDEPAAALLERTAFLQVGRAIVVDAARRPLGVVSVTDMERRVSAQRITGTRPRKHKRAAGARN
jgi:CBS domain-containing protein